MSKKRMIDAIEIKNPCSEDWDAMTGSEQVRFCGHCAFEVNNLSAMTRKQAMRLVREAEGRICVRYIKNPADETPLFAEKLYQITRRAGIAAGVLGASLSLSTLAYAQGKPVLLKRENSVEISQTTDSEKDKTDAPTAIVSGTVTDASGAVVPNVSVVLSSQTTKEVRTITADLNGFYEFKNVGDGVYALHFLEVMGFAPKEISSVTVMNGANVEQNVVLEVNRVFITMGLMIVSQPREGLHLAAANGDVEEVREIIMRGANVNQKDKKYSNITPLFVAVENGSVEIAETL